MKILLQDFAAYIFIRDAAARWGELGHETVLVTCESIGSPNTQSLKAVSHLRTEMVALRKDFPKYDVVARLRAEREYGRRVVTVIQEERPDVVISANGPLVAQRTIQRGCQRLGIPFVFWVQDLFAPAAEQTLSERVPRGLAKVAVAPFRRTEARLLRESQHVISIGHNLTEAARAAGVPPERLTTISNWADPGQIAPVPRDNPWAQAHDLPGRVRLLYAGTLGKKHPYQMISSIAELAGESGCVVVVSEGIGADWLKQHAPKTTVLPYQPESELPNMLGSADILLLLLGQDASAYSVPSKFYTYACAGRPVLALVPKASEIAHTIRASRAGVIADPSDAAGVREALAALADPIHREEWGNSAREWAMATMNPNAKAAQVEAVLHAVARSPS